MPWVEVLAVFLVSHLVGDFLLQTDWQAEHKAGGLGADPEARRALLSHGLTYTLAYVPALVWLTDSIDAWAIAAAAGIAVPHVLQDDGRALGAYMQRVKKAPRERHPMLAVAVDQSAHVVALFALALVVGDSS